MPLGNSLPSMTVVPLQGQIHSMVLLKATPSRTEVLSKQQEQVCWTVRQACIVTRAQTLETWAREVHTMSDWQAPDTTSLLPVAPNNLLNEGSDSRSQFAEDSSIPTTSHLPVINVLEPEKPTKAAMGTAEKTGKATEQMKGVEKTRLLLNEKLPVQAYTKFKLGDVTFKTENQRNHYCKILPNRQQLGPKYVKPSQLLEKENRKSELK
ncbi:hypothetical protein HJG60_009758 [Phyllostomus discolor]|uniref:Uncharacterized protein n=1 Tax=Phyllostomus discolor TaxID=89673 RepID=A0A834B3A7_9CHIR|nr:hypothetical protein HJG60_009758 [Phyllostomus discolor]